jgi:hypothetical protein
MVARVVNVGRPVGDDTERRELVVPFGAGAYVLRYRIQDETVVITRVWHSRERSGGPPSRSQAPFAPAASDGLK